MLLHCSWWQCSKWMSGKTYVPCVWDSCCFLIWGLAGLAGPLSLLSGFQNAQTPLGSRRYNRKMETTPTGGKEKLGLPSGPSWCCRTSVGYRSLYFGGVGALHPVSCCEQWNLILFTHGFPEIFSCFLLFNFYWLAPSHHQSVIIWTTFSESSAMVAPF